MSETFTLKSNNQTISGVLHLPPCEKPPVVVTCHGLFSSKNSDKFTGIAERFSREGLAVIRFDFRGCGESAGSIADTTVSGRLQDLKAVMRFAADHPGLGKQVAILGSSLGGVVALLYGAEYPVAALSVWATPYDLAEVSRAIPENDLNRLNDIFFSDARALNLDSALRKVTAVQVLQGKQDGTVPWQHANAIFRQVGDPKELKFFEKGNHSLSALRDRNQAIELSLAWLHRHLFASGETG